MPPLGRVIDKGSPNASFTTAELAAFVNESSDNAISFCIQRNPTTVYKYIKQNYGQDFPNMANGMEATGPTLLSMFGFLQRKYANLNEAQQQHWLWTLLHSLPDQPQVTNWTTPID